jgi:hypothetical protein
MAKKLLLSLAPILAVAAFAIAPAAASAVTTYGTCAGVGTAANCPGGNEIFTPFAAATKVVDKKTTGSGAFVLEVPSTGGKITCTTESSIGTDENVGGVGKSTDILFFDNCELNSPACLVNSTGADLGDIVVEVTDKVETAETVKITLPEGVPIEIPGTQKKTGCETQTSLGEVTGAATGNQKIKTNILEFTAAPGLALNSVAATITGSTETVTKTGSKKVYI